MNIGSTILTAEEELKVQAIYDELKKAFPECQFSPRETILGIGEAGKYLMCYFRVFEGNILVKFKSTNMSFYLYDETAISDNISLTIEMFKSNPMLLKEGNKVNKVKNQSNTEDTNSVLKIKKKKVKRQPTENEVYMDPSLGGKLCSQISECLNHISEEGDDITFYSCSTRLRNALYRGNICTIKDLKSHSIYEILNLQNFGIKCLHELSMFLMSITNNGDSEPVATDENFVEQHKKLTYINNVRKMDIEFSPVNAFELYLDKHSVYESIYADGIDYLEKMLTAHKFSERNQNIFNARLGINGKPQTLQEIGETYLITREGVRRIVEKEIRRLKPKKSLRIEFIDLEYARCTIVENCISTSFGGFVAYLYFESEKAYQFSTLYKLLFNQEIDVDNVKNVLDSQYKDYLKKIQAEKKQRNFNEKIYQHISFDRKRKITEADFARLNVERIVNTKDEALSLFDYNGTTLQCESFLEKHMLDLFLTNETFKAIKTQSLKVPFRDRYYYPDFQCLTRENYFVIIEVVPLLKMCEAYNIEKFMALKEYCEKYGFGYLVIDDKNHSFFDIDQSNEEFEKQILTALSNNPKMDYATYKEIYTKTHATVINFLTCIKKHNLKLFFPFALKR